MVDYFQGTNIPLDYVPEDQRERFIQDAAEASGGDTKKSQGLLWDIAQASSDPHKVFSGDYSLNTSVGDKSKGSAGKTYAELATSGASGFTDTYGDVHGPEVGVPDVDIHGYPEDWTVVAVEGGQQITKPGYGTYFKPTQDQYLPGYEKADGSTGGNDLVDSSAIQQMNITELTDDMSILGMLEKVMRQDSPLYRAAITRGMQDMARRGMYNVNTTLVADQINKNLNEQMVDLVKSEVKILTDNLYYNAEWGNKEIAAANAYVRERLLNKLQNAAAINLQNITNQGLYAQKLLGETGATERQRMETYASLIGKTYGESDQAMPEYWKVWFDKFG
jgi:hypothetical protein